MSPAMGRRGKRESASPTAIDGMKAESMSEPSFVELIERLQHDDRAAVDLLIDRYGNALRRAIERALWVRRLDGTASAPGSALAQIGAEASDVFQTVLLLFWRDCGGMGMDLARARRCVSKRQRTLSPT